ncbi:serine hydrolase domain-containing protein [Streptomyces sp. SCL15-6]|uniref:serine hydrolase domain-containing protein n=1 Tax=Streptomyces sp. SCL15-6 TaxID=2967222 RepID=UPI002966F78B|nr:serine hydrolase domain-containing protein [Streptomyces sp. SCL15-6]
MSIMRSRISRRTVTVLAVALLSLCVPAGSRAGASDRLPPLQRDADALRDDGVTGVSVRLETPDEVRTVRSGVSDLSTGQPVVTDGYLRIGSATKTFVAVVLLQLVGEGRLSLDDSVDTWLPGLVRSHGNDGHRVTLRQLLQHTSGLPDYIGDVVPDLSAAGYRANRWTTYTSRQRVALAMKHQPSFAPGAGWEYSNTNYVLLGMVIKAVTGHSWEYEVRARMVRPLRLTRTLTPGNWPFLPGPHARDYQQFEPGGVMTDTTVAYLPFDADADGSMISTAADTNRFLTALVQGRLLAPAQLAEMQRTVEVPADRGFPPGTRDGLGLFWTPLSCGGGYWGHSGDGFGYLVWPATTPDGRITVTVSLHSRPGDESSATRQMQYVTALVDRALCSERRHLREQHPPTMLNEVAATSPHSPPYPPVKPDSRIPRKPRT